MVSDKTLFRFFIFCAIAMVSMVVLAAIEDSIKEEVGVRHVPCLDERNREFVDEICEEIVYCTNSWFPILDYKKCSEYEK